MEKKRGKKSNIRFEWETEADKIWQSEPGDGGKQSLFKVSFMTSPSIPKVSRLRREKKCTGSELSGAQLSHIFRLQQRKKCLLFAPSSFCHIVQGSRGSFSQGSVTESSLHPLPLWLCSCQGHRDVGIPAGLLLPCQVTLPGKHSGWCEHFQSWG